MLAGSTPSVRVNAQSDGSSLRISRQAAAVFFEAHREPSSTSVRTSTRSHGRVATNVARESSPTHNFDQAANRIAECSNRSSPIVGPTSPQSIIARESGCRCSVENLSTGDGARSYYEV